MQRDIRCSERQTRPRRVHSPAASSAGRTCEAAPLDQQGAYAMLIGYVPILVMFLVALFIAVFVIVLSGLLGPKRPSRRKLMPYESGMEPIGSAQHRFPVKFNLVAMIFILFDIEVIFFFPYALVYKRLGVFGLIEMGVFMLILLVGFVYIWKRGALRWE
jgi:NADH-quinone oxidoreductase subunit A